MRELVTFIPKSFTECKSLLARIKGKSSATVEDRYQGSAKLDKEEIAALVELIEYQIGDKVYSDVPDVPEEAPAEEAPAEEEATVKTAPAKKPTKKTAPKK